MLAVSRYEAELVPAGAIELAMQGAEMDLKGLQTGESGLKTSSSFG